jgi:hypothetical protein
VPLLPTYNRFAVLAPEPEEKSETPNDECWDSWGMGAHGAYRRPREKEWGIGEDFVGIGTQTAVC